MLEFILSNQSGLWKLALLSAFSAAGGLLLMPWLIVRLPADYFSSDEKPVVGGHPYLGAVFRIGKNMLGALFLIVGLMLVVLPGPGVLAMLVGIGLLDFPGRRRLIGAVVRRKSVLGPVNIMRRRAGAPPLQFGR
jgi:hypothetical protein